MESTVTQEYVIEPRRSALTIDWRGILRYRDLLWLMVRRDFVAKYKQTILGPLWFLVQPLLTTSVYVFIFAKAARLPTGGLPPILFYLSGLLLWNYFAQCFATVSGSLLSNINLFSKVYFPRLVVPLATAISNLMTFTVQFALFALIYLYYMLQGHSALHPGWKLLLAPLLLFQTVLISLGLGLIVAALTAKYRDLTFISSFFLQVGMFLTPIIYPLSVIPKPLHLVIGLNPMVGTIEFFRSALFAGTPPDPRLWLLSGAVTLGLVFAGIVLFNRAEETFVDTI